MSDKDLSSPTNMSDRLKLIDAQFQEAAAVAHEYELDFLRYLICLASSEVEAILKKQDDKAARLSRPNADGGR